MSDFEWTLADEEMLQIAEKNFIRPKMDDLDDSEFEWDLEVIQDIEDAAGLPKWNNKSLWWEIRNWSLVLLSIELIE